jgi:hypothetical protein
MVIMVITISSPQAASTLLQKRNLMHFSRRKKRALLSLLSSRCRLPWKLAWSMTYLSLLPSGKRTKQNSCR